MISLSTIPDEIIEQIADSLRDMIVDGHEYAACYLWDNCTDFSRTRFDLSSFSKVCTWVRWPVERVLYRDIHVHFDGWNGIDISAHPHWRAGSLHLLLRTLEGRMDLRGCVKSVQMDWHEEVYELEKEDLVLVKNALRQFFSRCPSVQRLNIMTFPSHIFSKAAALSQITTVATRGPSLGMFHTIVKTFPVLQDLYLITNHMGTPTPVVHHQLKKLRIESQIDVACVFWALEVCAHITEELHMICSGYVFGSRPVRPTLSPKGLSPSAGTNLRSLHLVGNELNFLAHPNSTLAQAIRQLPSLQHLHVSRCLSFHAAAFSVLPASLRCLFLSEYGEWDDDERSRHIFVVALSHCLAQARRVVEMVAIHGVTRMALERQVLGDLSPLESVCNDRNIPFHLNIGSNNHRLDAKIRILCKSLLGRTQPYH